MLRALTALTALVAVGAANAQPLPRTPEGKPDLQGIWQAHSRAAYGLEYHDSKHLMPAGPSVVTNSEERRNQRPTLPEPQRHGPVVRSGHQNTRRLIAPLLRSQ